MTTFDEMEALLAEAAGELPEDFFKELNGGVFLHPDVKFHPESGASSPLYILGEYHNDRQGYGGLGRYIVVYYGSFMRMYSRYTAEHQRNELLKILKHEFTHHLESLAGERGLEIKDAMDIERYKRR
ncbi:MAG: metallopeptidase family protein [Clostridiales bacterium]|jgi:predicted Zn-dependent protease with MMP-like domain|nr:metallopeptidase family protein [Clostridiales bacterium]